MLILVTGAAGFIGSNLCDRLLSDGFEVIGIDNFNDYYDPKIKEGNLQQASKSKAFNLYREDILDLKKLEKVFKKQKVNKVVHLAARAGVRPSINNPQRYSQTNVTGTVNLLKLSVDFKIDQFIFGSSSSVYGQSKKLPFSEDDPCDAIISPYGSSKRAAELWVETFFRTYSLKSTILRLFTVYGPRGRPDMAPALFTRAVLNRKLINQFGDGSTSRDYTFIDDIIDGIVKTINSELQFEVINLGNNHPITLSDFIQTIEKLTGKNAKIKKMPIPTGDVEKTWANIVKAGELLGWRPKTNLTEGLGKYLEWLQRQN